MFTTGNSGVLKGFPSRSPLCLLCRADSLPSVSSEDPALFSNRAAFPFSSPLRPARLSSTAPPTLEHCCYSTCASLTGRVEFAQAPSPPSPVLGSGGPGGRPARQRGATETVRCMVKRALLLRGGDLVVGSHPDASGGFETRVDHQPLNTKALAVVHHPMGSHQRRLFR